VKDELGAAFKEMFVGSLKFYPEICIDGLKKTTKSVCEVDKETWNFPIRPPLVRDIWQ
jgi:hypothetical protein